MLGGFTHLSNKSLLCHAESFASSLECHIFLFLFIFLRESRLSKRTILDARNFLPALRLVTSGYSKATQINVVYLIQVEFHRRVDFPYSFGLESQLKHRGLVGSEGR